MSKKTKNKPIDQSLHQTLIMIFIALVLVAMSVKIVFL
jgi:hypothetical protein